MLHLHRFKGKQTLSFGNFFTIRNLDRSHLSGHRRLDLAVVDAMRGAGAARRKFKLERLALAEEYDALFIGEAGDVGQFLIVNDLDGLSIEDRA